jgi:hypothetical protein
MKLPRSLDPNTNPGLYTALASLGVALWQAFQVEAAKGPLTWPQVGRVAFPVVLAALVSWQRSKTTPVADPRIPGKLVLDLKAQPATILSSPDSLSAAEVKAVRDHLTALHAGPPEPDPVADRAAESERRWAEARRRGGYTGGGAAEDMRPPPTDVPSFSKLADPTPPPAKESP